MLDNTPNARGCKRPLTEPTAAGMHLDGRKRPRRASRSSERLGKARRARQRAPWAQVAPTKHCSDYKLARALEHARL